MIEALLNPLSSLVTWFFGRPRLRLLCGWSNHVNDDGVGTFVGFSIKIINPSSHEMRLERIEAIDSEGKLFFPSVLEVNPGREISPRTNVVAVIPCGHIVNTSPREISVIDATESRHRLKGKQLAKAVAELKAEVARLQELGFDVHPRRIP
jgi:hypothetical protein